jgi:hypothetical protein
MESHVFSGEKIQALEEEKRILQERIWQVESEKKIASEEAASQVISEYRATPSEEVLHRDFKISNESVLKLVENLSPEDHDSNVEKLIALIAEKGIRNALSVVEAAKDQHLEDDLHRFLVQYVRQGLPVKGLVEKTPLSKALRMTLFEVVLPDNNKVEKEVRVKELLSSMEQFYSGMLSISSEKSPRENHLVLEIANSANSEEFVFYVSVPTIKTELFEKQIRSVFPTADVNEVVDDYNIFTSGGESAGSIATSAHNPIFPLRTYESFDRDPLNSILNSFAKLSKNDEGASIQVLMSPAGDFYKKKYERALEDIEKGKPVKEAIDIPLTGGAEAFQLIKSIFKSTEKKDNNKEIPGKPSVDQKALELIREKVSKPIVAVSIRIATSAKTKDRAESILSDLESGFNQFANPQGNSFTFKRLSGGSLKEFFRNFAFRAFNWSEAMPLNLSELTSVMHFHTEGVEGVSQLKTTTAGSAPAPLEMPNDGVIIGVNSHRGIETPIYISDEDRLRHIYTIGQTGTGKSTLLINMIIQDIKNGNGACMIDPHGSDIQKVLAHIPPERRGDVIYFDPSYALRPMGLNMLEYDREKPEQKTFVVNELFSIFQKLYGGVPESMGPMFEQYFRNATMLVIEDPETGCTLLDVSRVMSNKEYRELKLSRCKNPIVVQFWREIASKAGGEASLANIVPYITSKFDVFLANDIMRPIIAQEKSAFNFRDIMDNKKILLVNLSKGRLGDINANLIGLILVGKILLAALSRVDLVGKGEFPPFYLYIDEFQNITTPSIASILSEARKYKLSLFIAHQFIAQLEESIKNAVFGNVGTIISYRVGSDDAEYLVKQFEPVFDARDLMKLDNFNACVKMLVHGKPVRPFNVRSMPQPQMITGDLENMKELSYKNFGRDKDEVEAEILAKYKPIHLDEM